MCKGIPVSSLPKTLQDAVFITRALSERYLWIDSLCIIQDCAADKVNEIGRMMDIYKRAYITISTASARDISRGFLKPRSYHTRYKDLSLHEIRLPLSCPNGRQSSILATKWTQELLYQNPTEQRAWVLQEERLSTRLLSFGRSNLLWRCHSTKAAWRYLKFWTLEEPLCRKRNKASLATALRGHPHTVQELPSSADESGQPLWANYWMDLVTSYTYRNLSLPEDKLNALSDLAAEVERLSEPNRLPL